MAFTVAISDVLPVGSGTKKVIGTAVCTAATTGGAISAASNGIVKITDYGFSCSTAQEAGQVVKTYDAGTDGDILTLTCQALASYDFWIEGKGI